MANTLTIDFSGYIVEEIFSIKEGTVIPAENSKYLAA